VKRGPTLKKICAECAEPFSCWPSRDCAFCSRSCSRRNKSKRLIAEVAATNRKCKGCGAILIHRDGESLWQFRRRATCGRRCYALFRMSEETRGLNAKPCSVCRIEMLREPDETERVFFRRKSCESCRKAAHARAQSNAKNRATNKVCVVCGEAFLCSGQHPQKWANKVTCGRSCSSRLTGRKIRDRTEMEIPLRCCAGCATQLTRWDGENIRDFRTRRFCGRGCQNLVYVWNGVRVSSAEVAFVLGITASTARLRIRNGQVPGLKRVAL
jgi:hypothetical protein